MYSSISARFKIFGTTASFIKKKKIYFIIFVVEMAFCQDKILNMNMAPIYRNVSFT
jgi:hypothetical protein